MEVNGDLKVFGDVYPFSFLKVDSLPPFDVINEGTIYYHPNGLSFNDGSQYLSFAFDNSKPIVVPLGVNWINSDFSFNPSPFNKLDNISGLNGNSTLYDVIVKLDTSITNINKKSFTSLEDTNLSNPKDDDILIIKNGKITNIPKDDLLNDGIKNLSDLEDFDSSGNNGDYTLVYNPQNKKYSNKKIRHVYENLTGAGNTFTIKHDLDSSICHVTVVANQTSRVVNDAIVDIIDNNNIKVVAESFNPLEKQYLQSLKNQSPLDIAGHSDPDELKAINNIVEWGYAVQPHPEVLEITPEGESVPLFPQVLVLISL